MAVKGTAQITLVDVTDAYSVMLTSESHTFPGSTSAALAGSVSTQVVAMQGAEQVAASVVLSEVEKPTGVTVTKDSDATSPTLTIAVSTSVAAGGVVKIPVHIGSDIVIEKLFSFTIAFKGTDGTDGTSVTVSSTSVTYQQGDSGTTAPTGTWSASVPATTAGKYLWTKTVVTYSDGKSTTAYSVSRNPADGTDGTSPTVSSTTVAYQQTTSGTAAPTSGTWSAAPPTAVAGQYLWTRTVVTYSDGKTATSYSVSRNGTDGTDGADALTLAVTSNNGFIFKNTAIATVLQCHVFSGGTELTAAQIAAEGKINWYKDGSATAAATGATLTIDAGDVAGKAVYAAQLEG